MKFLLNSRMVTMVLVSGSSFLMLPTSGWAEEAAPEKARVLLEQVKKTDSDRQISSKQTDIDRLKEDRAKVEADSGSLKKTIDSTSDLIADGVERLEALSGENKRLEHEMAVTEARTGAERARIEGLRALESAQGKSLAALNQRLEEVEARGRVRAAEMELLENGKPVPAYGNEEKTHSELAKWRKALALAEAKAQAEERLARDAMRAATAKMALAETRAATAKRLAEADPKAQPAPIAEQAKAPASEKPASPAAKEIPEAQPRKTQPASAAKSAQQTKPAVKAASATPKPATTSTGAIRRAGQPSAAQ